MVYVRYSGCRHGHVTNLPRQGVCRLGLNHRSAATTFHPSPQRGWGGVSDLGLTPAVNKNCSCLRLEIEKGRPWAVREPKRATNPDSLSLRLAQRRGAWRARVDK
jgi:hypothetical protein